MRAQDVALVEINEAFASMAVACAQRLDFDHAIINVNGGAVGLGHPVACSGARILVTLLYALEQRGLKRGLAAICIGGGEAAAMIVERL